MNFTKNIALLLYIILSYIYIILMKLRYLCILVYFPYVSFVTFHVS